MALTLSPSLLATRSLQAYKKMFPVLGTIANDLKEEQAHKGQQIIARISKVPTVADFNAVQDTNKQDSQTLLEDVPLTLNRHRESVIEWTQSDLESSQIRLLEAADNIGYAIAKDVLDYVLTQAVAANFSTSVTKASPDRSTLRAITKAMNANGAGMVRHGIVNSDVYDLLDADPEITSGDYAGQMQGSNPWGYLANTSGFSNIWEYPDTPGNSENLTGMFFDPNAFVLSSRPMTLLDGVRDELGIPAQHVTEVVRDPLTGLTFTLFSWQSNTSFNILTKMVVLYGLSSGMQGGSAGDKTDYSGCRLVSA